MTIPHGNFQSKIFLPNNPPVRAVYAAPVNPGGPWNPSPPPVNPGGPPVRAVYAAPVDPGGPWNPAPTPWQPQPTPWQPQPTPWQPMPMPWQPMPFLDPWNPGSWNPSPGEPPVRAVYAAPVAPENMLWQNPPQFFA